MNTETSPRGLLDAFEEWVMALMLVFMTLLTFLQVMLRYVFNSGLVWSLEATSYAFAILVMVGLSYGVRTNSHIAVDLLTRRLPRAWRRRVALLAVGVCIAYSLMMLYGSAVFVDRLAALGNNARDIPVPKWVFATIMPVGFALVAFRFAQAGWRAWRGEMDGEQ